MALVYAHPGALVRLVTRSSGHALAVALWEGADAVVTSRMTDLEVRAVLAGALRLGKIEARAHAEALSRWETVRPGLWLVDPTPAVLARAVEHTATHPLRASDCLHLACAELVGGRVDLGEDPEPRVLAGETGQPAATASAAPAARAAGADLLVLAWEPAFAEAGRAEGLVVLP